MSGVFGKPVMIMSSDFGEGDVTSDSYYDKVMLQKPVLNGLIALNVTHNSLLSIYAVSQTLLA